jgi:hypothetical protein
MPPESVIDVEGGDVHQSIPLAGEPTSAEPKGPRQRFAHRRVPQGGPRGGYTPPEGTAEIPFGDDLFTGEDAVRFDDTPPAEDPASSRARVPPTSDAAVD